MTSKKFQILELMWKSGLNQTKLSKVLKCSEPRLSRIINGHIEPTEVEISKLSEIFKTSKETLKKIFLGASK